MATSQEVLEQESITLEPKSMERWEWRVSELAGGEKST